MVKRVFLIVMALSFCLASPSSGQSRIKDLPSFFTGPLSTNDFFVTDSAAGTKKIDADSFRAQIQTPLKATIDANGKSIVGLTLSGTVTNAAMTETAMIPVSGTSLTLSWTNTATYGPHTMTADTGISLANAAGTNRLIVLEAYPDGTHVYNLPSGLSALSATNQPFAAGKTTLYFNRLGGTNYFWVDPAPVIGSGRLVAETSPTIATATLTSPTANNPTVVSPTITFPTVNYGYLGTNNTSFGFYLTGVTNTSGGTINQWEAVYVKSDGGIAKADADGSGTYPTWGLATTSINNNATGTIITLGNVRNDSWSFTPGATVWLSTTAGALTTTAPSTTDNILQAIGKAITASQLLLRPSQDYGTIP